MHICEFVINRFGVLHDQRVPKLSKNLTVFVGDNEAGKSTCLNFFRAMLFGYARQRRSIDYLPDVKAVSGGSLVLETETMGRVRLARRPGPHGGPVSLADSDGAPLPETALTALLRGCTPDVYDKVFAFSLGELAHFGSLTDERIRHALHGAAFGTGMRSPGQALKILEEDMRRIFAPRASSSKIHRLLQDLDLVAAGIRERGNEVDKYAALRAELEEAARELALSQSTRQSMEQERRALERNLALRGRWEALREAEAALAACPETHGSFTPDGRERLERLVERLEERRQAASSARRAFERAKEEVGALVFDPALAAAAPAVFSLAERKERVRDATNELRALEAERSAYTREAASVAKDLGPGWDADALEKYDISLAVYERCGLLGKRRDAALQTLAGAEAESLRLERGCEAAEKAAQEAQSALRNAGGSGAEANEASMDRLAQLLVRAGDAAEKTNALALAARNAEQALRQAIKDVDSSWSLQDLEQAALTPGERERFLNLSRSVENSRAARADRERAQKNAALFYEDAASRVAGLESSVNDQLYLLPGRPETPFDAAAVLDARRLALRRARTVRTTLDNAQTAYASANEQLGDIASLIRGAPRKNAFPWAALILFFAALLLVCGGGVFYLGKANAHEIMTLAGTGALAAGAALGAAWAVLAARGGTETATEAMERNWAAIEQRLIRTRVAAQAARLEAEEALAALALETPDIFSGGALDSDLLNDAEQALTLHRERLAALERDVKDLEREKTAFASMSKRLCEAENELRNAGARLDQAEAERSKALRALKLPHASPPEDARFVLERLDAALARRAHWQSRLAEQRAAEEALAECLDFAKSIPGLADRLASLPEPGSHFAPDPGAWLEAARLYIEEWKRAGRERIRLRELAAMRESRLEEAASLLERSRERLSAAQSAARDAEEAWRAWLDAQGLPLTLSPETARLALDAAAKAKSAIEAARRLEARIAAARGEAAAFVRDLAACASLPPSAAENDSANFLASVAQENPRDAQETNRPEIADPTTMASLFAFLDDLAAAAREAGKRAAVRESRERELPALADAATLAEEHAAAAQAEMKSMLALAACETPEAYRAAHAAWTRRETAFAAKTAAYSSLEREAEDAGMPLADLLASFRSASREETETLLAVHEERLAEALAGERALAEKKGGLDAAMAGLTSEKGLTELLAKREALIGEIEERALEWSRLAVARELLLTAKGRFESERQTGVARYAGELFSMITDGAYSGITVSLDDETVRATTRDGVLRNPETELSRGAREQLYLALRLAYVLDHGAQAEKLPVIMDDILVNFDARRAARTAETLTSFATTHQVLFFTCHESTADLLCAASPEATRYALRKGAFLPA